ncbi:MAG: hypothetical protein SFY32_06880 [Bacteroidota bacterium]|nr:hypothetical protein [Bacteroidota bacterium]
MGNYFSFTIEQAFMTPIRNIADKIYLKELMKFDFIQKSKHYFLCKTKKLIFHTSKSVIYNNTILKIEFVLGGKKTKIYSIDLRGLGNKLFIDRNKSNDRCIAIISEKTELPFLIQPETFEKFKINLENYPEILYIGTSRDFSKRLIGHEKVELARCGISEYEDLRYYFINFKFGISSMNENNILFNLNGINPDLIGITDLNKLDELMERIMIHFFKPELNELHKNSEIRKDKRLNEILLSKGITGVTCGYGMEDKSYKFWTKNQLLHSEVFSFDCRINTTDYYPWVDIELIEN